MNLILIPSSFGMLLLVRYIGHHCSVKLWRCGEQVYIISWVVTVRLNLIWHETMLYQVTAHSSPFAHIGFLLHNITPFRLNAGSLAPAGLIS